MKDDMSFQIHTKAWQIVKIGKLEDRYGENLYYCE
jgi:hypothetical protein